MLTDSYKQRTATDRQARREKATPPEDKGRHSWRNKLWSSSSKQTRTSCCMSPQWEEGTAVLQTLAICMGVRIITAVVVSLVGGVNYI